MPVLHPSLAGKSTRKSKSSPPTIATCSRLVVNSCRNVASRRSQKRCSTNVAVTASRGVATKSRQLWRTTHHTRTTQRYDRTRDEVSLDEAERMSSERAQQGKDIR